MPRAGWCSECGDWVWVDETDTCQNGHPAESVTRIHDAQPQTPEPAESEPLPDGKPLPETIPLSLGAFGVGEIPASLQRFNWGAFLLPALWGVVYNVWAIVGMWFLAAFSPLFLAIVFGVTQTNGAISTPSLIAITVVSDALISFVRVWAGGSANRLFWDREAIRLRTKPSARPKFTTQTYPLRQRPWAVWGTVGLLGGIAFTAVSNYRIMQPYGLGAMFVAEPVVFLAAQVALGVWLSRKMREEYPDEATPAA